jgi:hypothetical protein
VPCRCVFVNQLMGFMNLDINISLVEVIGKINNANKGVV